MQFDKDLFAGKNGIDIGGPSPLFKDIYDIAENMDCCNFSENTIWEGEIVAGQTFRYKEGSLGYQYICDATNLGSQIFPEKYDFVISSDCLEHIANPLKAITEFWQILKPNGILLIAVPRKETNFDHKRQITTMNHLLEDFNNEIGEDDLAHLVEILALHDLELDSIQGGIDELKERSLKNFENRAIHHHVFDMDLLGKIYRLVGLSILLEENIGTSYIITGRKV
jgi:SAM-dependent methyltransferase